MLKKKCNLNCKNFCKNNFLHEVQKICRKNKCLLILDNLETVLDQNILNFIDATHDIDHESKILISSDFLASDEKIAIIPVYGLFSDCPGPYTF